MTEADVEITLQRAHEKFPEEKPRVISDNGPQYLADDFKKFIRQKEMVHVTTSPYYPQSNSKQERFHRTIKSEGIRPIDLINVETAKTKLDEYVVYYNETRLHSAIGYVAPLDKLLGNEDGIFTRRKNKLKAAAQDRAFAHNFVEINENGE